MRAPFVRALTAAALLLTGCGGSDDEPTSTPASETGEGVRPVESRIWPKPAESPSQAVERLNGLAAERDCSDPGDVLHSLGSGPAARRACRSVLSSLQLKGPDDAVAFGSGIVADHVGEGHTLLVLDREGRYTLATRFDSDQPEVPLARAEEAAASASSAIRRDNCDELVEIALQYEPGGTGDEFCARPRIRSLHRALDHEYTKDPVLLGGDGMYAFYGLDVKRYGYFTLLFVAHENDGYAFVDSYPAG